MYGGNYIEKIKRLHARGSYQVEHVYMTMVAHDEWCAHFRGGECDCDPDVSLQELRGPKDEN